MKFMNCILVMELLLCIEVGKGLMPEGLGRKNWYTKELEEMMRIMKSTDAHTSRAKIFREIYRGRNILVFGNESENCPQRLRHIMSDNMNCRGVVEKLGLQLLSVQIFQSLMANEQFWESIMMRRNCRELRGETLELCEEALSGKLSNFKPYIETNLNQELNNCYNEGKGNQSNYLTKRYPDHDTIKEY